MHPEILFDSIMQSVDFIDDDGAHVEAMMLDDEESFLPDIDAYEEFRDKTLLPGKAWPANVSFAVFLGPEPVASLGKDVEDVVSRYPGVVVLTSTLVETATAVHDTLEHDAVIGIGFVPGLSESKVIEVAPALTAPPDCAAAANTFLTSLGFQTEFVEDRIGMVRLRVLATLINEAAFAVMEGVATPADIDAAMKLGVNYPKGLLEWADEIGIDVVVDVLTALHTEYGQERYRPCVLLKQYVRAHWLGRAVGRGFYEYDA